jgi:hypothetical protein
MKNSSLKSALTGAAIFGACGFLFLAQSFYAKATHTLVAGSVRERRR